MAGLLGIFEEAWSRKLLPFGGNTGADERMRHGYGACLCHSESHVCGMEAC